MVRVLVIGGTGHIGTYLVPRLVLSGHDVRVVARSPSPQVEEHCEGLSAEFMAYAWAEPGTAGTSRVVKRRDDRLDALRYLVMAALSWPHLAARLRPRGELRYRPRYLAWGRTRREYLRD